MARSKPEARQACELVLADLRGHEFESVPSSPTIAIYDSLLARSAELTDAFQEVHEKLQGHPGSAAHFFRLAVEVAAYWGPDANADARSAKAELVEVNQKIAVAATELADLLRRRSELHEGCGFTDGTHHSIRDLIDAAGQSNHLYRSHLGERFRQLRAAFKRPYWPSLEAIMIELATDAERADIHAPDAVTAAAIESQRPSQADCFRAWLVALEEGVGEGQLPTGFRLSDATLASLATCILALSSTEIIDAGYVKGVGQRMRKP